MPSTILMQALSRLEDAKKAYVAGNSESIEAIKAAARDILKEGEEDASAAKQDASSNEKPSQFMQRVMWAESVLSPILVVAVQLKLFQQLRDAGDAGVCSRVLAENSGIDTAELERILRHLKASQVIESRAAKQWNHTALSNALAEPHFQRSILFCHYVSRQAFNGIPEYFGRMIIKKNGDDCSPPSGSSFAATVPNGAGPFQLGMQTEDSFFQWLGANPLYASHFNHFMQAYRAGHTMWFEPDFYPVEERLVKDFNATPSDAFLVDVGGGKGHDLAAFAAKLSNHPGRLILQDQATVISEAQSSSELPFELQAIDFFTLQPVQSARAYFLHSILHDWGDEDCLRIIQNLRPALKRGYSKVLFHEIVLSEDDPQIAATSMDMMMLAHLNPAYERTETAWRDLLRKGGLEIVAIFGNPGAAESVIEAQLA